MTEKNDTVQNRSEDSYHRELKSPGAAGILAVIPGLGYVYNGLYLRAVLMILIFSGLIYSADIGPDNDFIGFCTFGFYVFMIIDSVRCAKRINADSKPDIIEDIIKIEAVEDKGSLFWGAFLIIMGGIFQFNNLGYSPDWLFKLWPLIIVVFGGRLIYEVFKQKNSQSVKGE